MICLVNVISILKYSLIDIQSRSLLAKWVGLSDGVRARGAHFQPSGASPRCCLPVVEACALGPILISRIGPHTLPSVVIRIGP
jgi:hypothetical protein